MKKIFLVLCISILSGTLYSQSLNISGYKVVQTNAAATYVIPAGTIIQPGGYVIIARNTTKAGFETFWGVTLPTNIIYFNTLDATGVAPKINGSETFTLQNATNTV